MESGKRSDRPALDAARLHRVPLVVAKVDRLTRSLSFLTRLLDSGVDVRFCDLPKIEGPTGRFILQQMASVAELEAGFISDRTKKAPWPQAWWQPWLDHQQCSPASRRSGRGRSFSGAGGRPETDHRRFATKWRHVPISNRGRTHGEGHPNGTR